MSFIIPRSVGGRYVIGLGQTVSSLDWDGANTEVLCEVDKGKETRLNDAKCDASGRLWTGDQLLCLIQAGSEKCPTLQNAICLQPIEFFATKISEFGGGEIFNSL